MLLLSHVEIVIILTGSTHFTAWLFSKGAFLIIGELTLSQSCNISAQEDLKIKIYTLLSINFLVRFCKNALFPQLFVYHRIASEKNPDTLQKWQCCQANNWANFPQRQFKSGVAIYIKLYLKNIIILPRKQFDDKLQTYESPINKNRFYFIICMKPKLNYI